MISGSLTQTAFFSGLPERLQWVLAYLAKTPLAQLSCGRHEIDGELIS